MIIGELEGVDIAEACIHVADKYNELEFEKKGKVL